MRVTLVSVSIPVYHVSPAAFLLIAACSSSYLDEYDFGKLLELNVDVQKLSRNQKYKILTVKPNSDPSAYPYSRHKEKEPLRGFKPEWLRQYPWLYYSACLDGAFCRACILQIRWEDKFLVNLLPSCGVSNLTK